MTLRPFPNRRQGSNRQEPEDPGELVVYSCVTRGYDAVDHMSVEPGGVPHIYFTDDVARHPRGWEPRALVAPPSVSTPALVNRYHKIFAHQLFAEFNYSVYLDGSIECRLDLSRMLARFKESGAAIGAFSHPRGNSLAVELDRLRHLEKLSGPGIALARAQLDFYAQEGLSLQELITGNYLLIRDHRHPRLARAMHLWWMQLLDFAPRDQLSLPYVLRETGLPSTFLDVDLGIDPDQLRRHDHRTTLGRRILRRARKILGVKPRAKAALDRAD